MNVLDHPVLEYNTMAESRTHLPELVDTAQSGLMVSVRRGRSKRDEREGRVAVVKTSILQGILKRVVADQIEAAYNEADELYTASVVGLPLAAEGMSPADAVYELVADIRIYGEDWVEYLRHAPNHADNAAIVYLAQSMSDEELSEWLLAQFDE